MRSPLLPIFLVVLVDVLGLTIVFPLLALYAEHFGASALTASLLVPAYAVCQLFAGPVLGSLSDRYGRKRILVISQLGTLVGFVILANASALWMVFLGRILDGATAGNLSIAQAYIADRTPPERRARAFGLIGIAFGIGFLFGPVLGGLLSNISLAAPFWMSAGLSACAILCTIFILPPEGKPDPAARVRRGLLEWRVYVGFFRRRPINGVLWQFFLYMLAFTFFTGGFALFAERTFRWDGHPFGQDEIGYCYALAGLIGALMQGGLIGRLVARYGEGPLTLLSFLTYGVGYVLLGLNAAIGMLVIATVVMAAGSSMLRPLLTALVTRWADSDEQGTVLGLTQTLASLAALVALLAGWLIEHGHLQLWTLVAAGFAFAGAAIAPWGSNVKPPGAAGHKPS